MNVMCKTVTPQISNVTRALSRLDFDLWGISLLVERLIEEPRVDTCTTNDDHAIVQTASATADDALMKVQAILAQARASIQSLRDAELAKAAAK